MKEGPVKETLACIGTAILSVPKNTSCLEFKSVYERSPCHDKGGHLHAHVKSKYWVRCWESQNPLRASRGTAGWERPNIDTSKRFSKA